MIKTTNEMIADAQEQVNCLNVREAKKLYDNAEDAIIIDLRETTAAEKDKLDRSVNIPRGLLEMKILKHCERSDTPILLHCAAGGRATLAALTLTQMGYTNVYAITEKFDTIKRTFG